MLPNPPLVLTLPARVSALVLGVLLGLFVLRVVGQIVVATRAPQWLPPMARWYSGLMPYRYLLPTQIAFVVFMTMVVSSVTWTVRPVRRWIAGRWRVADLGELRVRARHGRTGDTLRACASGAPRRAHPDRLPLRTGGVRVRLGLRAQAGVITVIPSASEGPSRPLSGRQCRPRFRSRRLALRNADGSERSDLAETACNCSSFCVVCASGALRSAVESQNASRHDDLPRLVVRSSRWRSG